MNLKKFKNSLFICTLLLISYSCSNEDINNNKENVSAEKLSTDKNFKAVIQEMSSYNSYLSNLINNKELRTSELIPQINTIINNEKTTEEQINMLNQLLDTDITDRLVDNSTIIISNLTTLNAKYSNLNQELIENAINLQFKKENQNVLNQGCGWRYSVCLGAAYSAAILCHAGCDTTALATTAGLGIPACIALCGTLQVFASVQCYDTYCAPSLEEV
jgi:alanyl-tRNA synthetase